MFMAQQEFHQIMSPTMLQDVVEAICDRPGDTADQRDARSRDVIASVQGFAPRDPVELMLVGMVVMHAWLIQHTARDLAGERDERSRARTKSSIVALDRGMLGFLREFRTARKRRLGPDGAEGSRQNESAAPSTAEIIVSAEASLEVMNSNPMPEPMTPAPEPSPNSPNVVPSTSARPPVEASPKMQTRPFARLPLTAKAKRQQTKALKALARRAASAPPGRGPVGYVVPADTPNARMTPDAATS
jgi:hypothetical protein